MVGLVLNACSHRRNPCEGRLVAQIRSKGEELAEKVIALMALHCCRHHSNYLCFLLSRECLRFCVLTPTTFSYYNSDDTSKYDNLKGAFDLASVEFGLGWDLNRKSPTPHIFHLKKPERTYYFAAESPQELADWEDHLRYVLQLDDFDEFEWDESDEEELGDLEGLPPPTANPQ